MADESTRRDINFTATGLSYAIADETNPAMNSVYLSGTINPLPEDIYLLGSQHQESLKYHVVAHEDEEDGDVEHGTEFIEQDGAAELEDESEGHGFHEYDDE